MLGGGSIGVELAQAWRRFGASVTVVESSARILAREEPEASALITEVLRREGVEVRTGAAIEEAAVAAEGTVDLRSAAGTHIRARQLLVATGRTARLPDLDVARAGLDDTADAIEVDEHLRAGPSIWAVGDVTGKGEFTHVATYQARIATADILGRRRAPARYHAIPRVTFSDPECGAVGMTSDHARSNGRVVRAACVDLATSSRGHLHGDGGEGLVKLVVDAPTGVLIGATSVGPMGGEVLSMLTLAVHARMTVDTLAEMIYAYPTFHRVVLQALDTLQI